jgi:hypothetical protein
MRTGYNIYPYIRDKNIFASHKQTIHHRGKTDMITIMIGNSCDSNKNHWRKFDTSYFQNPIVWGWTTPPSSWCWRRWCRWSQRINREWLWQHIPSYPCSSQFVFYILSFSASSVRDRRGYLLYSILGQDYSVKRKFAAIGPTKGKLGHTMRSAFLAVLCWLFSTRCVARWLHLLMILDFTKNDVAKRLGPFDVRKVPESQKHTKTWKPIL